MTTKFSDWLANRDPVLFEGVKKNKALRHFQKVGMPKKKRQHSDRVRKIVKRVGADEDAQIAALFHDYLERGGRMEDAKKKFKFSPRIEQIILALSDDDKNDSDASNGPLAHMRIVLANPEFDIETKKIVILIKIADRLDNLKKRILADQLGKSYIQKSKDLLQYLFIVYRWTGTDAIIANMYKEYLRVDNAIKKKNRMKIAPHSSEPQAKSPSDLRKLYSIASNRF